MHPYGTDSNERIYFLAGIIPLSIWAAQLTGWFLKMRQWGWPGEADFLFDPTSAVTFYALFYSAFNHWLWRWSLFRHLRIVTIPDLNGQWQGEMCSSFHNFEQKVPFIATIEQTWSKMVVRVKTGQSGSHSETASFILDAGTGPTLSYTYLNRPKASEDPRLEMHQGTCVLVLKQSGGMARLEGEYYSSRGRANHGDLWMERISLDEDCQLKERVRGDGGDSMPLSS
ncbi:MAG: hypothetical protein M3R02_22890 [Chloroflexota bacterium]|nr:hypothetical protein [Chloroflexota bacterium]